MTNINETLFWIAMVLIIEPTFMKAWPLIRIAGILSIPPQKGKLIRVETYLDGLNYSHRFGIMMPLRKRIRTFLQSVGVLILVGLSVNNIFK